ncbi:hypothetical protein TL16_g06617 [Triparma laevis f. inornata]|uniref:Uncharacterized protein n=1 Tax=Triparma laevis f. inornata TaxID=1714386 RepID=A0A9W7ATV2_9STRA|nr:hypothetical protein TL16_g06617 [Triparma laevis f. inornata]
MSMDGQVRATHPIQFPPPFNPLPHPPQIDTQTPTTLDESIPETILRDLHSVSSKLRVVLLPSNFHQTSYEDNQTLKILKDWDLWGPLLICLGLSIVLSIDAGQNGALVFSAVFMLIWLGEL